MCRIAAQSKLTLASQHANSAIYSPFWQSSTAILETRPHESNKNLETNKDSCEGYEKKNLSRAVRLLDIHCYIPSYQICFISLV